MLVPAWIHLDDRALVGAAPNHERARHGRKQQHGALRDIRDCPCYSLGLVGRDRDM
jgi:hypothetical protein